MRYQKSMRHIHVTKIVTNVDKNGDKHRRVQSAFSNIQLSIKYSPRRIGKMMKASAGVPAGRNVYTPVLSGV